MKIGGIVWYATEKIYIKALAIFEDAFNMPTTYVDWMEQVKEITEKAQSDGWVIIRAEFDPDTFPAWCKSRGLNVDAKARVAFGNEAAAEHLRTGRGKIIDFGILNTVHW